MVLKNQLRNSKLRYYFILAGVLLISFAEIVIRYITVGDFAEGFFIGIGIDLEILGIIAISRYNIS